MRIVDVFLHSCIFDCGTLNGQCVLDKKSIAMIDSAFCFFTTEKTFLMLENFNKSVQYHNNNAKKIIEFYFQDLIKEKIF